jgi:hypothetical protein
MSVLDPHRLSRLTRSAILAACLTALATSRAPAQWSGTIVQADSLLASGRVTAAESLYYAASSARPRDALARAALGRYLASRGALRIGAVLLEEARLFGGDTVAIARSLAPIYGSLGDYRALATLPRSPLSSAEQARVRWLVGHPPVLEFPDSVSRIPYTPLDDGTGIGVIAIALGERMATATIDPRVVGIVVSGSWAKHRRGLHTFGDDSSGAVALAPELHVGDVTLTNVPVRLDVNGSRGGHHARTDVSIGLDVLRHLAPTFDPGTDTLTLRRTGQVAQNMVGTHAPMIMDDQGLRLIVDGRWESVASRETARLLAARRWTLDAKRGFVVLE